MYGYPPPRGYTTLVASLVMSLVVGLAGGTLVLSAAALAGPPTLAQAGPVLAAASAPDASPGTDPLVALGQAVLAVNVALLFLRRGVARVFNPPVATDLSRTLCLAAALVVGLVLGLVGVAPAWGVGIGGQVTGGFVAAGVAVFGHSAVKHGWRARRRKAKATEPPPAGAAK